MNSNQLVTLVVPIYNVKKYITRCLDSIKGQTYQNIEVILVNDGSTDGSEEIAKSYCINDSRFVLLHKENGGLSSARNYGMKYANGSFISFIDSDDFVSTNYVEKLLSSFEDEIDVVIADYAIYDEEEKKYYRHNGILNNEVYSDNREKQRLIRQLFIPGSIVMPVWKNMYRLAFLKSNGIVYVSERKVYTEDFLFNLECYLVARKIKTISDIIFYHLVVKTSLSQTYRSNYFGMQKELNLCTTKLLQKYDNNDLLCLYKKSRIDALAGTLLKLSNCSIPEALNNIKKVLSDKESKELLKNSTKAVSLTRRRPVFFAAKLHSPILIVMLCKTMIRLEPLYRKQQRREEMIV